MDDEYCPEATNVEISTVAAQSYYQSLVQKQTDLGEILLRIVMHVVGDECLFGLEPIIALFRYIAS